jgi:signal transduction histidine kinase
MPGAENGKLALPKQLRICVLSKDLRLYQTCHEVIVGLGLTDWDLTISDPDPTFPVEADLLVWDVDDVRWSHGEWHVPPKLHGQEQLFVVRRKAVQDFLDKLPLGAGSTLLKPVTAATLKILVEQAAARARSHANEACPNEAGSQPLSETTDRRELLQCLLAANLKLQEYDHDRTNFLARAVHDFRAPLTAISGYCGLLQEKALGPLNRGQTELVQRMQHSVTKLTRMASTMLQLSVGRQVEKGVELKASSIRTCIEHALHEIGPVAAGKRIKLSVDVTDPNEPLFLEPEQIEQVLVNLLDNACKFTPKGGEIEVRAYPTAETEPLARRLAGGSESGDAAPSAAESPAVYRVDVSDTGTGISDEYLESVFEEYTSYTGSQDRSGGGLGLAICKMILMAHGGRIWAENHVGGARLSFLLPVHQIAGRKMIPVSEKLRASVRSAVS